MNESKRIDSKENTREGRNQLLEMAGKIYNKVPPPLRWIVSPLTRAYRYYRLFLGLRVKLWVVTGVELNSRMPLSIMCAANDSNPTNRGWDAIRNMNYLLGSAFDTSFRERYLGRTWLWRIPKLIMKTRQDCSLMVVQIRGSNRKLLRLNNCFYIPNWVFGQIDLPLDPMVMKDSSLKSDLRRIRKNSLQFEVTRDPQYLHDFYHNMYVPYISRAHRGIANILTYDEMKSGCQNYDLLLVTKQGRRIAGILIVYEKTGPRLWVIGVLEGNSMYIKDGAVGALYHFSLQYLQDKDLTKVSSGYSRAFLSDGVLQYKKKWSQKIVGTSSDWFALKILSYSDAAKAFFQENPFIFDRGGSLQGAIFVDGDKSLSSKDFKKVNKKYFHSGLDKIMMYRFPNDDAVNHESVPPEFSERIVLRSLKDII